VTQRLRLDAAEHMDRL